MQEAKISLQIFPMTKDSIILGYDKAIFNKKSIIKEISSQKQKFMLFLHTKEVSFRIPDRVSHTGITDSWYIALDCFGVQQYPATILFSAIAVESVLNHDKRLYTYRNSLKKKWISLSLKNLKKASEKGIDVSTLIDKDGKDSEFITRRNKIAHGDLAGYVNFLWEKKPNREITEKITITRKQALDQLNRSFQFITAWANTNPTIILEGIEQVRSATR
jgi:hypothetical protein